LIRTRDVEDSIEGAGKLVNALFSQLAGAPPPRAHLLMSAIAFDALCVRADAFVEQAHSARH
jgi:hypothetical protein